MSMLNLNNRRDWVKPNTLSLFELRELKAQADSMLYSLKKNIEDFDEKYDLYLGWLNCKSQFIDTTDLESEISKLDSFFGRIFFKKRLIFLKEKLRNINNSNLKKEQEFWWKGMPPYIYSKDLAWNIKESWDTDGREVYTFFERTSLMDKEIGKKMLLEKKYYPLYKYRNLILIELKNRLAKK